MCSKLEFFAGYKNIYSVVVKFIFSIQSFLVRMGRDLKGIAA